MKAKSPKRTSRAANTAGRKRTGSAGVRRRAGIAAGRKAIRKKTRAANGSALKKRKAQEPIAPAVVLATCTLFMGINLLLTAPAPEVPSFKGYVTVCYRGSRPLAEIVADVQRQPGIDAVVSRETAEVLYTEFSGPSAVRLAEVKSRFDALDPRFDGYMKELERYFTVRDGSASWEVFYAATALNPLSLSLFVGKIAGTVPADWFVDAANRPVPTVVIVLLGSAFFFFLLFQSRRPLFRLLLTIGLIPWMYALSGAGIAEFILFLFLSAYWSLFLKEGLLLCENEVWIGRRDTGRSPCFLRLGVFAGMILFTAIHAAIDTRRPAAVVTAFFFMVILVAGYWWSLRVLQTVKKRKFRALFGKYRFLAPFRRYTPPVVASGDRPIAHVVILCLCLIPTLLAALPQSRADAPPLPRPLGSGMAVTMSSLRRLGAEKPPAALPDLSDFVRHAAFQERLAYAGKPADAMPAPGEGIVLSEYQTADSGRTERSARTILSFDDVWLSGLAARAGRSSVERMLFTQGQCLTIVAGGESRAASPGAGGWTIIVIFSIVLFPIVTLQYTAIPRFVYGKRKSARPAARKKRCIKT
jgi:hypothetical protein